MGNQSSRKGKGSNQADNSAKDDYKAESKSPDKEKEKDRDTDTGATADAGQQGGGSSDGRIRTEESDYDEVKRWQATIGGDLCECALYELKDEVSRRVSLPAVPGGYVSMKLRVWKLQDNDQAKQDQVWREFIETWGDGISPNGPFRYKNHVHRVYEIGRGNGEQRCIHSGHGAHVCPKFKKQVEKELGLSEGDGDE